MNAPYNYSDRQIEQLMKMFNQTREEIISEFCHKDGEVPKAMRKVTIPLVDPSTANNEGLSDSWYSEDDVSYNHDGMRSDDEYNPTNWRGHCD